MKHILAAIDPSLYATSVIDHAAWAANRLNASVELLHVIQRTDAVTARHDISGALGLGAKSGLMEELVSLAETQGRLAREQGKLLLAMAEARLQAAGVSDISITHRHGGVIETIIEREADADLVVIGKRGEEADFARGHIGHMVERVVRESVRPVLVAARAFTQPSCAVLAYDGGPSARKAVTFLAAHPLLHDVDLHLVTAGGSEAQQQRDLDWALGLLPGASLHRVAGQADSAIQNVVQQTGANLLIMGAYGHSPLRTMILGSTTTVLMQTCRVPVLLFR